MHDHLQDQTPIRTDLGAIFVSLELSRSTWLITSLSPGAGEKLSKQTHAAPLPAARGDFLFRAGRRAEAKTAFARAAALTQNERERAFLLERAAACGE